jgi:hypothetical protein
MGCYQEGIAKDSVGGKDVTAHIFEFVCYFPCCYRDLTDVCLSGILQMSLSPTQVKSQRALVRFRSCFASRSRTRKSWIAIAGSSTLLVLFSDPMVRTHYMRPPVMVLIRSFIFLVCILLDVGTKPTGTSIYELWKCMPVFPRKTSKMLTIYIRFWYSQKCWRCLRRVSSKFYASNETWRSGCVRLGSVSIRVGLAAWFSRARSSPRRTLRHVITTLHIIYCVDWSWHTVQNVQYSW